MISVYTVCHILFGWICKKKKRLLRVDIRTCTALQVLQITWNCKYQFDKLKSPDNNAYPNSNFIISPLNPIWWRSLELSLWDDWTVIIYSVWLRNNSYFPLNFKMCTLSRALHFFFIYLYGRIFWKAVYFALHLVCIVKKKKNWEKIPVLHRVTSLNYNWWKGLANGEVGGQQSCS